ncbi:hypothetical protein CDV36_012441 [Fusarium kuroshium]|uniref:Thioesterase domain-containing protein n=1 Tax=Fusarium kuroshium TaxID=2010991 RepID=A0A3M2RRJ7_9HYPO|nr:hypothetical protein CDV36_012441 [Fusarium kuroshium]
MDSEPAHTRSFEDAIAVHAMAQQTYSADLDPSWSIGDVPHGGYLAAIFYRVAKFHFSLNHPTRHEGCAAPINIQLTFVRRASIGRAILHVIDIKLGRRTSVIQISLMQSPSEQSKAVEKAIAHVTISNLATEAGLSLIEDQTAVDGRAGPEWIRFDIPHPEFRKATGHVEVYQAEGSPQQSGLVYEQRSALTWDDGCQRVHGLWTNEAATFLLDVFPMLLAGLEKSMSKEEGTQGPIWFPTLTITIDFRKELPKCGVEWLRSRTSVKSVKNGRTAIEVELRTDETGEVVAVATHAGLMVDSAGNRSKM